MPPRSHPVRIAVQIHPQHAEYAVIRETVARVEEMGADIVYNWDHFYPLYGDPDGKHFEAWTMLGSWAEQTSTIEIGCLVTCHSYRNPHLLADMARTVDHASGGRLIFGVGSGWFGRDYEEYGYGFGTKSSRLDALAENLVVFEQRLEKLNPQPTRQIPVLIAGTGPRKTLPLVARHAVIWHAKFPDNPDELRSAAQRLVECCREVGRDPGEIEWSYGVEPYDIRRILDQHAGTFLELGFTGVTLGTSGPDYPLDGLDEWVQWRDEINSDGT